MHNAFGKVDWVYSWPLVFHRVHQQNFEVCVETGLKKAIQTLRCITANLLCWPYSFIRASSLLEARFAISVSLVLSAGFNCAVPIRSCSTAPVNFTAICLNSTILIWYRYPNASDARLVCFHGVVWRHYSRSIRRK